jgi:methionine-R-sulfoxide reductase
MRDKVIKSDDEWRALLSPERFRVLRRAGTEPAFSGELTDVTTPGVYRCAGCASTLFSSAAKFHSGCGWPSFFEPIEPDAVTEHVDSHRSALRRVRRTSWPRLHRRTEADWLALLHQLGCDRPRPRREVSTPCVDVVSRLVCLRSASWLCSFSCLLRAPPCAW